METKKIKVNGQELEVIIWPKGNTMDDMTVRPMINGEYANLSGATNLQVHLYLAGSNKSKSMAVTNPRFEGGNIKFTVRGEAQMWEGLYQLVISYTMGESLRTFGGYPFILAPIGCSGGGINTCPEIELPELVLSMEISIGGGGTSDHRELTNRDAPDQHPIDAISGLRGELDDLDAGIESEAGRATQAEGILSGGVERNAEQITKNTQAIELLQGIPVPIGKIDKTTEEITADPTLLDQFATDQGFPPEVLKTGYYIIDLDDHWWTYREAQEEPPLPAEWIDEGQLISAVATNSTLGIVKGSTANYDIAVREDGTMYSPGLEEEILGVADLQRTNIEIIG